MFGVFFTDEPVVSHFAQVMNTDLPRFKKFFSAVLQQGIYIAPSAYEAGFVSAAHTMQDLDKTLNVAEKVFSNLGD